MGDTTALFLLEVYEIYRESGDRGWLRELYPS